jgi:hypothetical protein
MIKIFRKSALSAAGNAWPYMLLSGLLCFGFSGHAFENSQHAATHSTLPDKTPQPNTLPDKLPAVLELPAVLGTTGTLKPIQYQPMVQQSIDMPELLDWKQANNRVKDLGGWMFYASEALATEAQSQPHPIKTVPVKEQP